MITGKQIRAARAFLDWDRYTLSVQSGVSEPQIANFETGKTESPRQRTLMELEAAFLRAGVILRADGGIMPRTDCTTRFEGDGWYLRLIDDVYMTLKASKQPEVILLYGDETKSPPEIVQRWKDIRDLGARIRRVVREGNTYLPGPLEEYRYMPAEFFYNNVVIIYGTKVASCAAHNTMALVIDDEPLSASFKLRTDFDFKTLPTPTKSTAHGKP